MSIDPESLRRLLCERLCREVGVALRPDGSLMLETHFEFPDGDRYPIWLSEAPDGRLRLSDCGHTLMHLGYDHEVDSLLDGTRGMLLERLLGETGLARESGAFCLDTTPEDLSASLFRFGQALTRIYDLSFLSKSPASSTFYEDLTGVLREFVDESKVRRDYEPEVPNAAAYPVDYRIEGKDGAPLFLYGIPNGDKARLTTIMLAWFHRHALDFESLLVFADQAAIPRMDLARLSDVGGEMITSLEAKDDLNRKLRRRVAA